MLSRRWEGARTGTPPSTRPGAGALSTDASQHGHIPANITSIDHIKEPKGTQTRGTSKELKHSKSATPFGLCGSHAFGATLLSPLMIRSIASPPVGSVRLARSFRVNFIRSGWVRPRWAAIFMTFGLPMSFTKARPSV